MSTQQDGSCLQAKRRGQIEVAKLFKKLLKTKLCDENIWGC